MNIGLIIIVIVTASLIIGPIMMLRPNTAQKNRENLRTIARSRGVHFSMRNIPRQPDEIEQPAAMPVYFIPPAKTQASTGWMLVRTHYQHDIHFLGWWAWQGEARATSSEIAVLNAQLPNLPESVRAISAAGDGACVYWSEQGGEPVLQQVLHLLESLKLAAEDEV